VYSDLNFIDLTTGLKDNYRGIEPGSETGDAVPNQFLLGWASWITGTPALGGVGLGYIFAQGRFAYFAYDDPTFVLANFLPSKSNNEIYTLLNAPNAEPSTDLSAFKQRGGKLIIYNGWLDPFVAPRATIDYYQMIKQSTRASEENFMRLFLMPGLGHCGFGPGPQIFDGPAVLENWVEHGQAPDSITAFNRSFSMNRPICPYPKTAKLIDSSANANESSNWTCQDNE
ncbi:MAG: tannase/feruloyl esterase family alpha/beta hydrolase, partial [bacterium]|nr:tannase/feruloyl esterase family alpha/beta hydrolase [bacterium]